MGKKTKMRECPAAGHAITSAECGAGRHAMYVCPEHCAFNPFATANYEQYLKIENAADEKFFRFLLENIPNRSQFEAGLKPLVGDRPDSELFCYLAWHGYYRTGLDGETVIGRLAKAGFPGLTRDESLLMKSRLQMRPGVLEAHRILDDRHVEVVDLLDPGRKPFVVVDRTLAAHAVRFGVYAMHVIPLPHYHRLFGAGIPFPDLHPLAPEEVITEIVRHSGGATDEASVRDWFKEHFARFEKALVAVSLARRQALFENLDAQFGKAVYELTAPFEECVARLDEVAEVAVDRLDDSGQKEGFLQARVWFAKAGDPEREHVGEGATLGRVLLGKTHWRLEGMGATRLENFRNRFEIWMQERVRFAGERRDDLGARFRSRTPAYDPALVPPALLRDPPQLYTAVSRLTVPANRRVSKEEVEADQRRKNEETFLGSQIPALDGKTPREAAVDPNLRPKLLTLMKHWVCQGDRERLETGRPSDATWMVRELGLNEILFEPPPPRRAVLELTNDDWDETDELDVDLPPPPALPAGPWSKEEAKVRFDQAVTAFPKLTGHLDYLVEMGYPLFENLQEATGKLLEPRELQFLSPIVAVLVCCFAPPNTRPPDIDYEDLIDELTRLLPEVLAMVREGNTDRALDWMKDSAQPELLEIALGAVLAIANRAPANVRPRETSSMTILLVLKVLVNLLDRAMRGG
jgi:hypothetical protein